MRSFLENLMFHYKAWRLERMRCKGAAQNIEFQVAAENLSGPASKWKPEQFFDTRPLEAALKELGRK